MAQAQATLTKTRTAGKVQAAHGKAQHVDLYRKLLLRRKLLTYARPGPVYVPFIGDGDIAAEVYADRLIYGANLDEKRVRTARARFAKCQIIQANCDGWPFPSVSVKFAIADFDAYAYPYDSFRSWWSAANKADRVVLFFTDGQPKPIEHNGHWHKPDGTKIALESLAERRTVYNLYFIRFILPWLKDAIGNWRVIKSMSYRRMHMLYWGAVIERGQ